MPTPHALRDQIQDAMKAALKAQDKGRLGAIRLIVAAIKQREVDQRVTLDDSQTVAVLEKMAKQRRDSIDQYRTAGREDLATQEEYELSIIQGFLPPALSAEQIDAAIDQALAETGAGSMREMGKVMTLLKQRLAGQADMAAVSARVKTRLG